MLLQIAEFFAAFVFAGLTFFSLHASGNYLFEDIAIALLAFGAGWAITHAFVFLCGHPSAVNS
jgi:hypothetical protein